MTKLTKVQMVTEITKCAQDPVYFLLNYAYIIDPKQSQKVLFKLYDYQRNLVKTYFQDPNKRFIIINKARQLGITTLVANYVLWVMLFREFSAILNVATDLPTAQELFNKTTFAYDLLPDWLKIMGTPVVNNTKKFSLSNGSVLVASPNKKSAGRSFALNFLLIDEAAHIDKIEDLWTAAKPTLATGGRAIVFSTPNGTGNWF